MKFYKSIKFKALAGTLLLIIILCAAFIRIIPDYSTSRGFVIVSLSDYDKYKQGYCLKEDRILPKEELYKRAILDFLEKGKIILYTMRSNDCKKFKGIKECRDIYNKMLNYYAAYGYGNKITYDKVLEINRDRNISYNKSRYIYFELLNLKPIVLTQEFISVNLDKNSAGFTTPIIQLVGEHEYYLYNGDGIILNRNKLAFTYIYLFDSEKFMEQINKELSWYDNHKSDLKQNTSYLEFDNCGTTKTDIDKSVESMIKELADMP